MDINHIFKYQYFSALDKYSPEELKKQLPSLDAENVKNLTALKKFIEIGGDVLGNRVNVLDSSDSFVILYDSGSSKSSVKEFLLNNPKTELETVEVFQILLGKNYKKNDNFRKFCNSFCSNTSLKDWLELEVKMEGTLLGLEPLLFRVPYDSLESLTAFDEHYEECQNKLAFLEERLAKEPNPEQDVEVLWKYEEETFSFSFEDPVYESLSINDRKNLITLGTLGLGNSTSDVVSDFNVFFPLMENDELYLSLYSSVHTHHGYEEGLYKLLNNSLQTWNENKEVLQLGNGFCSNATPESKLLSAILSFGGIPDMGLTPPNIAMINNTVLLDKKVFWKNVVNFLDETNLLKTLNIDNLLAQTKSMLWKAKQPSQSLEPFNSLRDYLKTGDFDALLTQNHSLIMIGLVLESALKKNIVDMKWIEQLSFNHSIPISKGLSNVLKEKILNKEVTPNNVNTLPTVRF